MEEVIKDLEGRLEAIVSKVKQDFAGVRTNRPTTKLVEDIAVEYYGQMVPLKQLGSIAVVPPREITVTLWDKSVLVMAEKAIRESNLGLGLSVDGSTLRLTFPPLTEERRAEIIKIIKQLAEEGRIKIRTCRDEAIKRLNQAESEKKISEDQKFLLKDRIQKAVDKANAEIEKILLAKSNEVSER
jgi:ribosome recycling factor